MEYNQLSVSDGTGEAVLANIESDRAISSITIDVDSVENFPDDFIFATGDKTAANFIDPDTMTVGYGHLDAGDVIIDGFAPGYTDAGNTAGQILVIKPTTYWADEIVRLAKVVHENDGQLKSGAANRAIDPPQGFMINGKISRTVASNNITFAIKTLANADPSADDPVYVRIGNTVRTITAALSLTLNSGTNWFAAGASYFAGNEGDFFVYLIWNTTDSAISIAVGKEPDMRTFADASGTTTAYGYLAYSGSAPASTDEMEIVGRTNAILGASASYNWSLPATEVTVNKPINETRVFTFTNTHTIAGTFYYQQRGVTKEVWGQSANRVTAAGAAPQLSANGSLTLPVGFFSTLEYVNCQATDSYSASNVFAGSVQAHTTTTISGAAVMSIGSNGQTNLMFHVVGR